MTLRPALSAGLTALAVAAFSAGCSTELDPRAESEAYFSLWGALDASADTQWVRVAPVRAGLDPDPDPLDAAVTLVDVQTGGRWPMRDSVVAYAGGRTAHAFWTTADVAPDRTYRVEVRRSDGAETRATVAVPADFPPVRLSDGRCACPQRATVAGAERVVDVLAVYRDRETGRVVGRFSKLPSVRRLSTGPSTADVYYGDDAVELGADPLDLGRFDAELLVVAGTAAWPEAEGFEASVRPLDAGQIENGVGFVGGVVTRRVPFEPGYGFCPGPGGVGEYEPCFSP